MTDEEVIAAFEAMYQHTKGECGNCRIPHSCCDELYCEMAKVYAKEYWDVELQPTDNPRLPFMGPQGCTVPPHLRPICTVHTCDIGSYGYKPGDPEWTVRYFELRELCEVEVQKF